jgi:serine/threonine protein kinase
MFNEEIKRFIPDYLEFCKTVDNRFKLLQKLGKGRYGKVYLALDLLNDKLVALKCLANSNVRGTLRSFVAEITTLVRISLMSNSFNATKILDFNLSGADEFHNPVIYYTMEYVELGELFVVLEEVEHISEKLACYFFKQLCESLSAIHSLKILHLDLKPENVLVDQFGGLIICDFGNSAFLGLKKRDTFFKSLKESPGSRNSDKDKKLVANDPNSLNSNDQQAIVTASKSNKSLNLNSFPNSDICSKEKSIQLTANPSYVLPVGLSMEEFFEFLRKSKFLGTSEYAAPEIGELEILQEQFKEQNKPGMNFQTMPDLTKLDVFSLGVLLFVIYMKSLPFGKANLQDPYYKRFVENKEGFWKIFAKIRPASKEFKEIVQEMLDLDNKNRAVLQILKSHRWVTKNFPNEEQTKRLLNHFKNKLRKSKFNEEKGEYHSKFKANVGEDLDSRPDIFSQPSPKMHSGDSLNFDQKNQNKLMLDELEAIIHSRKTKIITELQSSLERKSQKTKPGYCKTNRPFLKEVTHIVKEFVDQNRLKLEKLRKILLGDGLTDSLDSLGFSNSDENSSSFSGENLSVSDSNF